MDLRKQQHPPPPPTQDVPPLIEPLPPVEAPAPPPSSDNTVINVPGTWSKGDDTNSYNIPSYVIGPPAANDGMVDVDDLFSGYPYTGPLPAF